MRLEDNPDPLRLHDHSPETRARHDAALAQRPPLETLDAVTAAREEAIPGFRAIRKKVREPRLVALRLSRAVSVKGKRYAAGTELLILNPESLPPGVIAEGDAADLLTAGAAVGLTDEDLAAIEGGKE